MATGRNNIFVNKEFDWDIFKVVFKRKWLWFPVVFGVFITIAYLYLRYTKPVYQSVAVIQVENKDQGKEILDIENLNYHDDISEDVEVLKSEFLFIKAIQSLHFDVSYFSKGEVLTMERYGATPVYIEPILLKDSSLCNTPIYVRENGSGYQLDFTFNKKNYQIPINENKIVENKLFKIKIKTLNTEKLSFELTENEFYFKFNNPIDLARRLISNLSISVVNPEAKTIQIKYKSNTQKLCKDITEAVYLSFFKYDEEKMKSSSEKVLLFIDQQLDSIRQKVKRSKDSIKLFQLTERLPNPEMQSAKISDQITTLTKEKFIVNTDLQKLQIVERKIASNPNKMDVYQLIPELIGASFESSISTQITELYVLLDKKNDLSYSMTKNSAEYKLMLTKIDRKIASIRQMVDAIKTRLITQLGILNERIADYQQQFIAIPSKQMELSRLKNIQELNSKYYDLLMDKKTVYQISNEGYSSKNIVLKKPVVPTVATSPNVNLVYTIAIMLGLFFCIGIFVLFYLTHNEIGSVQDLEKLLTNAVILGTVPQYPHDSIYSQLLVVKEPKSSLAEAFRNIRTNLQFISSGARVFSVSSSISGEGKTFVCLNLAGIIALSGKSVIVLDLDLRKPKIHHGFKADNKEGMSNILIGKSKLEDCIQKTALKSLDFISAGAIPPNPSELIMSKAMDETIEKLKKSYDVIIIDNPPIGLVSDGISLMTKADCPIYIFKANYSKRSFTYRLKELHKIQRVNSINVILNAINTSKRGYGYGYGYGVYGEDEQAKTWWARIFKK